MEEIRVPSYHCRICRKIHYLVPNASKDYTAHLKFAIGPIADRPILIETKQMDLVRDYGFPKVPEKLKIGGKKK